MGLSLELSSRERSRGTKNSCLTKTNKLNFMFIIFILLFFFFGAPFKEMELNTEENSDKRNNHSSSAASTPTNELLLIEASTDNELIIHTNGLDNGINGKLSADLSPNDLMLSSSRSSTSDNGMESPPRACIMRALTIVSQL